MAPDPKTIDNLGMDASKQYAENIARMDQSIITEAKGVTQRTEEIVTTPYYPSEFDSLFETGKINITWANFPPPPEEAESKKRVFSSQFIPSLGSADRMEAQIQRITSYIPAAVIIPAGEPLEPWEQKIQIEEQEKEKAVLLKFEHVLHELSKNFTAVKMRLKEYAKG
jgi:hypothetical protein